MADTSATIIAASLSSEELEKSIYKLVDNVATATELIRKDFDDTVSHVKKSLSSIGDIKINTGGSGTSKGGTGLKQVEQEAKSATASLDNLTKAQQVAIRTSSEKYRNADTLETMNIQLNLLRERLREARNQYSSFVALASHATTTGDKGLYQFATEGVHKYSDEVRTLIPQIRGLQNAIQQMGDVIAPQGHTIQNYVNSLQKANPELAQLNEQFKKGQSELQNQSTSYNNATQSAHQYTEEIRRQAQAIRESQEWKQNGSYLVWLDKEKNSFSIVEARDRRSVEEQLLAIYETESRAKANLVSQEKEQNEVLKERLGIEKQVSVEKDKQSQPKTFASYDSLKESIAHVLGLQKEQVKLVDEETASYRSLDTALKQYKQAYNALTDSELKSDNGKMLIRRMQEISREIQKIQALSARPISLESIIGKSVGGARVDGLSEKTLDDIAYKMQRLASYRSGLDVETQKKEIRTVNQEYDRLKKKMDELMQKNQQMIGSNNALGRSWNYMKNRLAFYFTVGAGTQFIKNLIDIRGQYELLERSIGILIDSAQNGSQIFAELNSMAIKSPFTTMELGAAAKQLAAYDVAAKDVVDTTRRLADMAAAVGIPIERLTYALGQIKAYGYLNARDARMFANAGIPLVKELADRYTELEGRLVSTADVYDRIKKKAISYEDVMATVNKMTDEGGKFFNFQEKAADTLKVRIANLTLAWNNMMNEIGAANQGVLSSGLKTLSDVFKNWRSIYNLITSIIVTFGVLKGTQVVVLTMQAMKLKENITLWNALEISMRKSIGAAFVNQLRSIGGLLAKFANPVYLAAAAVTALSVALLKTFYDYRDLIAANEAFNKSVSDNAKENIESIEKFFEDYKKQLSNIGGLNNADQEKLWERIQEEIEKTTKNAEDYIRVLNNVENVSSRIRLGEDVLEQSKRIQREIQHLADSGTFSIGGGFANDSAAKNLQNYQEALNEIRQEYGSVNAAIESHTMKSRKLMADYTTQRNEVRAELNDFVSKLDNAYMPEILGQSDDVRIQMANVRSFAESLRDAFVATEEGSKIGADGIVLLNNAIDKWITKQGVANNLIVNANGDFDEQRARIEENKTAWEDFFRYISKKDKEYLDAAIKTNNIGSEEVRKIWDKAAEEMSQRATTSYDLIQDQIAQLRNTPDIVINVIYRNEKQKLDKDQEEFEKRFILPEGTGAWSTDKYLEKEKENREKYGTIMRKQGEDTVEYEKRISDERKTNLALQKKNGDIIEENKNKTDAYSQSVTEQARKEKKAADDRLKAIKEIEDASGYDFSTKSENAAARKAQKQAESELAKALKDELSTIDKVRSIYKELTKEGMSHADAVERATKGWNETTNAINRVLQKNGLQKLDLSKFAGVENPRELLNTLQAQLKELVKRGASTSEIRVLQTKIQTVSVEADKYDLTKITKGLNNELDKLKDEYELAVSLDADPELGSMFADWMGIDMSDLPRTAQEYAKEYTDILNKYLRDKKSDIKLPNLLNITNEDLRAFQEQADAGIISQEWVDNITKGVKAARDVFKKETSDQIKDWEKLFEKYAEYEAKVNKIHDDAVKERVSFAQQFAKNEEDKSLALKLQTQILAATDPQEKQKLINQLQELILRIAGDDKTKINLVTAISNSEQQGVAKADFEKFQKSPEWITATGDIASLTTSALNTLINSLEKYKKEAKNLDPKQVERINKALRTMRKEVRKDNPFNIIANAMEEAKARGDVFDEEISDIEQKIAAISAKISKQISITGFADENDVKTLEKYNKRLKELKDTQSDVTKISFKEINEQINAYLGIAMNVANVLSQIASTIKDANMARSAELASDIVGNLQAAGQGYASGGWIGAVVGGVTDLVPKIFKWASMEAEIDDSIKDSERAVKRLELAYVDLEHAIDKAYGTSIVGSKRALASMKELQLAELERQLELERSRNAKNRDEDRIIDLQKQIKELRYEIEDSITEITNDLLGGEAGSFAEGLVEAMIDSFKKGEDYMKVFEEKFEDMIDNMIMKSIVSKVVAQYIDRIWDDMDKNIAQRSQNESDMLAAATKRRQELESMDLRAYWENIGRDFMFGDVMTASMTEEAARLYGQELAQIKQLEDTARMAYNAASEMNDSDISNLISELADIKPELGERLREILGEYYKFGETSNRELSALQQGIQGVTETTAGALEAYMNGVSQQVYYQSDLMTQIRDAVISFNMDVQVASMSQILLQLRSSYEMQMAIHALLSGWNNPAGNAIRVEMI